MKQSAVEFLLKEFSEILSKIKIQPMESLLLVDAIDRAKGMEKEQIVEAFKKGFITHQWDKTKENKAEQYYNETFKTK
jgi:hypothetical protein